MKNVMSQNRSGISQGISRESQDITETHLINEKDIILSKLEIEKFTLLPTSGASKIDQN